MSRFDYEKSRDLVAEGYPFYAIVMAAMRQADPRNVARLRQAFPETWDELERRYNAPGGLLPGESLPKGPKP